MVSWIFQKVRKTLQMKPLLLWGIRLLAGLLVWLAAIGFWTVPAVAFALNLVLSGSVALIFLRAYQGTFPEVCDLFSPFRLEQLPHLVGGMAWMSLWVFLWTLIPVAGLVLGPVKLYTYRLTPYILMTRPDVKATEAIQVSARETKGYRGKMFLADLLIYGSWAFDKKVWVWISDGVHQFLGNQSPIERVGRPFDDPSPGCCNGLFHRIHLVNFKRK